jgi:hypothetical protein
MTPMMTLKTEIANAGNCRGLRDALNRYEQMLAISADDMGEPTLPPVAEAVDLTALPTWGPAPANTAGVYSWDDEGLLYADAPPPELYLGHDGDWCARGGPWSCD